MDELGKISNSEMIKIKANIIGKAVHCDKWVIIVIPFIAIAISIAGILYSQKKMRYIFFYMRILFLV